jgi:hypothetical protein
MDYKGIIDVNQSNIVPLHSKTPFNTIRLSWFTQDDVATTSQTVAFPATGSNRSLPIVDEWGDDNVPALLRTQLMQTGPSFTLADYDANNSHTLFLYPALTGSATLDFALDARRTPGTPPNTPPELARCYPNFSKIYACSVEIALPNPANGDDTNRNAMLRLSALYNGTHYKVELLDGSNGPVQPFDRVQPEVDSTGRANDMFRRVKSRVEFKGDFIYPDAAVDIVGSLCKNFTVIDRYPTGSETFGYNTACTP